MSAETREKLPLSNIRVVSVERVDDPNLPLFKQLVRDFLNELGVSLDFQGVEAELAELPGKYSRQFGGCMLLLVDDHENPCVPFACAALRDLGDGNAEVKRMFVKPSHRGKGHSRVLLKAIVDEALAIPKYERLRLDTLRRLTAANALYKSMGFYSIEPYNFTPIEDVLYFEYNLKTGPNASIAA